MAGIPIKWPIEPQPEMCGWCGEDAETQNYALLCYHCGRWSNLDGTPIVGNVHHRANVAVTMPEANRHGMAEFERGN